MTTPIPSKLHVLLAMAMEDIEEARNNPRKVIDLYDWRRQENGVCIACFAGHHLNNRYPEVPVRNWDGGFDWQQMPTPIQSIADVLNGVRKDNLQGARDFYCRCGTTDDWERLLVLLENWEVPKVSYYQGTQLDNPERWLQFQSEMSALITFLKEHNL